MTCTIDTGQLGHAGTLTGRDHHAVQRVEQHGRLAGLPESAEGFARVRATRQQRLTSEDPLLLRAVINEAALRREVGGPDVMRDQARRLVEIATLPNVTVQVLPFSAGAHPGMTGPFTTLRFAERSMNVVFIELRGGAVYQERLSDRALSEDDTTSLLNEIERGGGLK